VASGFVFLLARILNSTRIWRVGEWLFAPLGRSLRERQENSVSLHPFVNLVLSLFFCLSVHPPAYLYESVFRLVALLGLKSINLNLNLFIQYVLFIYIILYVLFIYIILCFPPSLRFVFMVNLDKGFLEFEFVYTVCPVYLYYTVCSSVSAFRFFFCLVHG
jgi:hypothetical protein